MQPLLKQWEHKDQGLDQSPCVAYRSAIAHQLARASQNLLAEQAAEQLAHYFSTVQRERSQNFLTLEQLLLQSTNIQIQPFGQIQIQIPEAGLVPWLHHCSNLLPTLQSTLELERTQKCLFCLDNSKNWLNSVKKNQKTLNIDFWQLQYVHARCCSLLRLAHAEALITLKSPEIKNSPWMGQIAVPTEIPWQYGWQRIEERHLLGKIIALTDALSSLSNQPQIVLQRMIQLVEAFQAFYSACQIWGNAKRPFPQIAQARLGWVSLTQMSLGLSLQAYFGLAAPLEL